MLAAQSARAVYAPVPEQDLGKSLVLTLKSGLGYDSNLFGGATSRVESAVFHFAPKVAWNASLTSQTFASVDYQPTVEYFENRPGERTLDSHVANLRFAHAFSATTTLDVLEVFRRERNPESLLNGLPLNSDQSNNINEIDVSFSTAPTAKTSVTLKVRGLNIDYRDADIGRSLNRFEDIIGASGGYAILPEFKAVAEFRHQDVFYGKLGETKNKRSDYLMAGADYDIAKKLTLSGRVGTEWRHRSSERSTSAPYAEFTAKYTYAEDSFFSGGYMYTLEETSDTGRFTDTRVHRVFASMQHHVTALIVASASLTYEAAVLQGRRAAANLAEDTVRGGVALTYVPTKNWSVALSYDADDVSSPDPTRVMVRHRAGLSASYSF